MIQINPNPFILVLLYYTLFPLFQLNFTGPNSLIYFGLYEDKDPNPTSNPGNIIMSSYLVFYT